MDIDWGLVASFPMEGVIHFVTAILVAMVCGLIVGIERESKGKPAGLRTLVLISVGSCLYCQASVFVSAKMGDPGRIAAQIVTGIGFLGAGAIIQKTQQGYIAGLTTAASIWVTAAVGMLAGLGHYVFALAAVSLVVLSLRVLAQLEGFLFYDNNIEIKRILYESNFGKTKWELIGILEENLIRPDEYVFQNGAHGRPCLELQYNSKNRNHRAFFWPKWLWLIRFLRSISRSYLLKPYEIFEKLQRMGCTDVIPLDR